MVARTARCRYLPRWHSEFCQIPLRIPVTNKRCAVSFRARLRTPPRLFRFGSFQEPRERPFYCSTRCRANHLPRFEQPRRSTTESIRLPARLKLNPESLTAYCL